MVTSRARISKPTPSFQYRTPGRPRLQGCPSLPARGGGPPQALKANSGSFRLGHVDGPGRPVGARSKLSETALQLLGADFAEHGRETIEKVRLTKPGLYLSLVVSLLPRQLQTERLNVLSDMTDCELERIEALLAASRARTVHEIERHNGAAIDPELIDARHPEKP